MVIVDLMLALICFNGNCHPVLIGENTPKGEFQLVHKLTDQPGYDGHVLEFLETSKISYAVHKVFLLDKEQHRDKRIKSIEVKDRIITDGCINVTEEVFNELVSCCESDKIKIE